MAYAVQSLTNPAIRLPHIAIPKLRRPRLSPGARALLMMGLMISPAFISDYIGYGVERLFYTSGQIAEMRVPNDRMFTHRMTVFHVACADPAASSADRQQWDDVAARNGWPRYPEAGATCFKPDRVLLGVVGLKTFNVACPTAVLSVADRQQWTAYTARHGWGPYPQAGADCVDP
jgi:hypothetical protein